MSVKVFSQKSSLLPVAQTGKATGGVLLLVGGKALVLKGLALQVIVQNSADYAVSRCFGNNLLLQSFGSTPTIITISGVESLMSLNCSSQDTPKGPVDVVTFYRAYGVAGATIPQQRVSIQIGTGEVYNTYSCIPVDLQQQVRAQPQNPLGPLVRTYKLTMIGVAQQ